MQTTPAARSDKIVSMTKLKDAASRLLPANSIARSVMTSEPDVLPLAEALSKFEVFDRLLVKELGSARGPR